RDNIIGICGEFFGTVLFLLFAFAGTQTAYLHSPPVENRVGAPANTSTLLYIALSFGFSLAVSAGIFFRISGGLFNPAVTFGLVLVRAMPPIRGALLVVVQLVGGIVAAALVSALLPGPLTVGTSLGGGTSVARGLFIEMFLTSFLLLTVFFLAIERQRATFIAPVGFGLALFVAMLAGAYFTGASLNPARSFGPCVVMGNFQGYHWIYWVGPGLGSIASAGFYKLMKLLGYETANVGQHGPEIEMAASTV
ncbi:aquaporin-like protein, partial [Stachybotrys elegans]